MGPAQPDGQALASRGAEQVSDGARQVAHRQHGDGALMPVLARRGFTLIELMIALVLLGIVSTAVYKVLVNNQRLYTAQTQTIDLQQNIRAAAAILPAEFRELDAADGDIKGMTATSLRIRAMRALAFVCADSAVGAGSVQISLIVPKTPICVTRQMLSMGDPIL